MFCNLQVQRQQKKLRQQDGEETHTNRLLLISRSNKWGKIQTFLLLTIFLHTYLRIQTFSHLFLLSFLYLLSRQSLGFYISQCFSNSHTSLYSTIRKGVYYTVCTQPTAPYTIHRSSLSSQPRIKQYSKFPDTVKVHQANIQICDNLEVIAKKFIVE